MSNIDLTKAWNKSALPNEGPEISPPVVNVFAIDTSGNQMQQRERNNIAAQDGPVNFGSHVGGRAESRSSRKGTDSRFLSEWLQLMSPSYQQAYHEFMDVADNAIEYYDQFDNELDQMKAELGKFKTAYDKNTIRLSDERRVYVDENGEYAYQDAYGNWNKLEDSAVAEAKAKHQILGDQAVTKAQKVRLDEFEAKIEHAQASNDLYKREAQDYSAAAENGDLSQDDLNRDIKAIKDGKNDMLSIQKDLEKQQQQISQDIKPDQKTVAEELNNDRANSMLGNDFKEQPDTQMATAPPSMG